MSLFSGYIDECSVSRPEAIAINVQLDYGKQECLYINSEDDPKVVAKEFADKHGLDNELEVKLEQMISEQMVVFRGKGLRSVEVSKQDKQRGIHNRLYMESKFKKRSGQKKVEPTKEVQVSEVNYGLLMYEQNKSLTKEKSREKFVIKRSQYEKEAKELTFRPNIPNNVSTSSANTEFFIKPKGLQRIQHMPLVNRELQECSFRPKINSTGQSTKNIHEKLYRQGLKGQKTFKDPASVNLRPEERAACVNRLLNSHLRTEAKLQKSRTMLEGLFDPETLRPKFVPEVGREPQIPQDQPVWTRLYGKETKEEEQQDNTDIYKAHRMSCYKNIFESLNSDPNGLISEETLENSKLDNDFCSVLRKILKKGLLQQGLSQNQFIALMENGINYLNIQDRVTLFKRN